MLLSMQGQQPRGKRGDGDEAKTRRKDIVIIYNHPRNPMEYIFVSDGEMCLTQEGMGKVRTVQDVYNSKEALFKNLCAAHTNVAEIADIDESVREKIELYRQLGHGAYASD